MYDKKILKHMKIHNKAIRDNQVTRRDLAYSSRTKLHILILSFNFSIFQNNCFVQSKNMKGRM